MTDIEKLLVVFRSLPNDARSTTAKLLRQIAHDLQSPLSTLSMEVYSAQMLLDQLDTASSATQIRTVRANLGAISANMERASSQLAEYLSDLASISDRDEATARKP